MIMKPTANNPNHNAQIISDLQKIFSSLEYPIIMVNENIQIDYFNSAAQQILQWPTTLLKQPLTDVVHFLAFNPALFNQIQPGKSYKHSCWLANKYWQLHIYHHEKGNFFTIMLTPDSKQHSTTAPHFSEHIVYPHYCSNQAGELTEYNPAFLSWLGYTHAEPLSGKTVKEALQRRDVDPQAVQLMMQKDKEVFKQSHDVIFELNLTQTDPNYQTITTTPGYRKYIVKKSPVKDPDTRHTKSVSTTMLPIEFDHLPYQHPQPSTNFELSPTQLGTPEAGITAQEKMNAECLANISHNLRTPLHNISGIIELLQRKANTEVQKKLLTDISITEKKFKKTTLNLLKLIELDLLKKPPPIQLFNPIQLCRNLSENFIQQAKHKGIDFKLQIDNTLPTTLLGHPEELEIALHQLLENACRFTNRGTISFTVDGKITSKETCTVYFSISDTGIGISQHHLAHIFKPFYCIQATYNSSTTQNNGMGLTIVRSIASRLNASLQVSSHPNQGSTFNLILTYTIPQTHSIKESTITSSKITPVYSTQATSALSSSSSHTIATRATHEFKKPTKKRMHMLVVEDDRITQCLTTALLEDMGHYVDAADDGKEALDLAHPQHHYDVIFMDIGLPKISGLEAIKRIRQYDQHTKIVIVTAHVSKSEKEIYFEVGANAFLSKPIDNQDLSRVI